MSAVLTTETDVRAAMREIGAAARRARASSPTPPGAEDRARSSPPRGLCGRTSRNSRRQRPRPRRGAYARLATRFVDRLMLDDKRIEAMACGVEEIAALARSGRSRAGDLRRPNGLRIERVATPLGVVGVIYESRPNVTADAGALCLKSGNAVVLARRLRQFPFLRRDPCLSGRGAARGRAAGGGDFARAVRLARGGRRDAGGSRRRARRDRAARRKSLVERVQREARVPVFAHLEGLVHVYVDADGGFREGGSVGRQFEDAPHRGLRRS